MKTTLKRLLAAVMLTTTVSVAFAESYNVDSVDGTVKISISLQGGGVAKMILPAFFVQSAKRLFVPQTLLG